MKRTVTEEEQLIHLAETLTERIANCDRRVLGFFEEDGVVIAGLTLVAPDCIMFSAQLGPDNIFDAVLN